MFKKLFTKGTRGKFNQRDYQTHGTHHTRIVHKHPTKMLFCTFERRLVSTVRKGDYFVTFLTAHFLISSKPRATWAVFMSDRKIVLGQHCHTKVYQCSCFPEVTKAILKDIGCCWWECSLRKTLGKTPESFGSQYTLILAFVASWFKLSKESLAFQLLFAYCDACESTH